MNDQPDPRLARLEHVIREQDERFDRSNTRRQSEVEALKAATTDDTSETSTERDTLRMTLLDRIEQRCPKSARSRTTRSSGSRSPRATRRWSSTAVGSPRGRAPTS